MKTAMYSVSGTERSSFFLPALTVSSSFLVWILVRKFEMGLFPTLQRLANEKAILVIAVVTICLLVIFAVSHVIDLLSQSIFERFLSDKLDGFPHERIVPMAHTTIRYKRFLSRKKTNMRRPGFLYEGAKAMVASAAVLVPANLLLRLPSISSQPFASDVLDIVVWYCCATLAVSLVLAFPAAFVSYAPWGSYESRRRRAIGYSWRLSRLKRRDDLGIVINRGLHWIFLITLAPLTFAYDLIDRLTRALFRLNKEIDNQTYDNVERVAKANLKVSFAAIQNNDRFWLPYLYVMAHGGEMARLVSDCRKKASFYRNQALACVIASLILGSTYRMAQKDISGFLTRSDVIHIAIALYFLGWLFHWKFLQQYYSLAKAVLRSFATLPNQKPGAKLKAPKAGSSET